ncbi:MAG: hypothetical protein OXQ84_20490 [bacterium]|nr:hypothetical protein [bacterium]
MKASYRLIDYSLRPGKFAERKMLCEVFSRLRPFSSLRDYVYVGFGSIWFADHVLFHKSLGISELISIERVSAHAARFEFNRPFANVDVRIGSANQQLTGLDWGKPLILWLDYDDPLSPSILDDVRTVATRAESGMLLTVSVQANGFVGASDVDDEEREVIRTPRDFRNEFGDERTPGDLNVLDLTGWKVAKTSRVALRQEIDEALLRRNVSVQEEERLEFHQVAAFEYADGAKMTTIAGILVKASETGTYQACGYDELEYFRDGVDAVRIKVPKLTPKEMRFLDSLLPGLPDEEELAPLPPADAKHYGRFYRYLPNFASFEP